MISKFHFHLSRRSSAPTIFALVNCQWLSSHLGTCGMRELYSGLRRLGISGLEWMKQVTGIHVEEYINFEQRYFHNYHCGICQYNHYIQFWYSNHNGMASSVVKNIILHCIHGFASCNYLNAVVSPLQLNLSIKDFSMSHCVPIERVHYTSNRSWGASVVWIWYTERLHNRKLS